MSNPARKFGPSMLLGLALLLFPAGAEAGLYNPCEPDEGPFIPEWMNPARNYRGFRDTWLKYRSFAMKDIQYDNPERRRYVLMEQTAPGDVDKLTDLQILSLSEYLIRRGKARRAKDLLLPLVNETHRNFLALCNMASACQQLAETEEKDASLRARGYDLAIHYMQRALKYWPATWKELEDTKANRVRVLAAWVGAPFAPDWREGIPWYPSGELLPIDLQWTHEGPWSTFYRCRKGEEYYLKLLNSRKREAVKKISAEDEVDALFTDSRNPTRGIRYVDEQGQFAPGKLAEAERALLPDSKVDEAIIIVQQLLVWLPTDRRLYRQLGELYNARGNLRAAQYIFDDLVSNMHSGNADLKKRRRILADADIPPDAGPNFNPEDYEADPKVLRKQLKEMTDRLDTIMATKDDPAPMNWKTLAGVSLGFGFAAGVVGLWQVQEILRRLRRNRAVPENTKSVHADQPPGQ